MPLPLQAKLLRVIEDGTFERVGGTETLSVDVRIIAATNRDMGKEVREGRFREDLWYRLNVYTITVPALRDRMGDIDLLVPFFAKRFCKQLGKPLPKISKGALNILKGHSWPGNIRELRHAVERALINWQDGRLQFDVLETVYDQTKTSGKDQDIPLKPMVEIERDHISRVLANTGWKVDGLGGAAEILQLNPSTLRSRMKKLGIRRKNE